jgi:tRNA (cytidine/uridine-2'-O-)-methyltransferase
MLASERPPAERTFAFTTRGTRGFGSVAYARGDWLVFGSETAGLSPDLLEGFAPAHRLRLPMRPGQRSLNLSNAVAVAVFEAWRQLGFEGAT